MKIQNILFLILTFLFICSCSSNTDSNENTSLPAVPAEPSNLYGLIVSPTQVNLSWLDNSYNETGFVIERKIGGGTFSEIGTTAKNIKTYNNLELTSGTEYTYRVCSKNAEGNSINYSNEFTITTPSTSVSDIDGNIYPLVNICNQFWTKTNLNVTKYRNGDIIPQVTNIDEWSTLTTGAWCYYNNDQANETIYGKLYNWYAINDPRGIAPEGYHIPSNNEWSIMINCLDPNSNGGTINPNIAGGKMKEFVNSNWLSPNVDATNSSGFSGLPGGSRRSNGLFTNMGSYGFWWSSTELSNNLAIIRYLSYNFGSVDNFNCFKKEGFSVRCIKD